MSRPRAAPAMRRAAAPTPRTLQQALACRRRPFSPKQTRVLAITVNQRIHGVTTIAAAAVGGIAVVAAEGDEWLLPCSKPVTPGPLAFWETDVVCRGPLRPPRTL